MTQIDDRIPMSGEWTTSELLTVIAARHVERFNTVFVGIGLPTIAVELASQVTGRDFEMVYESGVIGARPDRLAETIADAPLVEGALCVLPMHALFGYALQGGHIDVAFLGAAQIDRYGNLNTTCIGPYSRPRVRLPGSGGAADIVANAGEVIVVVRRHTPQTLSAELDFVTSASRHRATSQDPRVLVEGGGVTTVITELGVFTRAADQELQLAGINPGVTVDAVRENTGWEVRVASELTRILPPTEAELTLLREVVDPDRVYLR